MKGKNEAHRVAILKRREERKATRQKNPTAKNNPAAKSSPGRATNTPKVFHTNFSCPAPTRWQLQRERSRHWDHGACRFQYLYKGKNVTRKELRVLV